MKRPLTIKQQRFVDKYEGNTKQAAKHAKLSYDYCRRLVTESHIIAAIQHRESRKAKGTIATREERQEFWTETMRNDSVDIKDRQKASELMGKSEADFTDKVQVDALLTIEIVNYGENKNTP